MAETRPLRRRSRGLLSLLGVVLALVVTGAAGATPTPAKTPASGATGASVQGWLGDGATWPERAVVLYPPRGTVVSPSTVHVTENGAKVSGVTVTPLSQAGSSDFGLMVILDQSSSMAGAPTSAALAAVRSLAASRSAGQQIGLVTFASQPTLRMALTTNPSTLGRVLSRVLPTHSGADVPSAMKLGLSQLASANVALGAIIVVSDGVGHLTGSGTTTPAAVTAAAQAANIPVFTVGLQDQAATAASLRSLAALRFGQFLSSSPAHLTSALNVIYNTVSRGYVVRWQSQTRPGKQVAVVATVAGAPGSVQAGYQSPGTSAPATPAKPTQPVTHPLTAADISLANKLSAAPGFATVPAAATATPPATLPVATTTTSFWNSSSGILVVSGICGLLLALAVSMALYRPAKRAVRTRVGNFLPGVSDAGPDDLLLTASGRGGIVRRFERGTWWLPFVENVEISGSVHTPIALVKRSAALGMVVGVIAAVASGSVMLALIPMVLWPFALKKAIARKAAKQREKFRDTLPGYLQDLASAMRVGRSFVSGLTAVVETADEPIRGAFERAITDEALGRPLEEALEAAAVRMQASDLEQVALIAGLNRRSGSNVSEALDRVAEGARDRADLRREIKALTGQARMSSWVLTALPGVLLLGINVVSPRYGRPLLHTTIGIVLLCVAAGMVFAGFKVMTKITDVEP